MASPRLTYDNRSKLQARPGQIVYFVNLQEIVPMRVLSCDERWYYDLQPLRKTLNGWRAKPLPNLRHLYGYNPRRNKGWIGHSVDMGEFCLTHAEARFRFMCDSEHRRYMKYWVVGEEDKIYEY